MPLSPQEAASRINVQVTVEMLVKAAKNCQPCSQIFLDSEEDHHDPKNLAVVVYSGESLCGSGLSKRSLPSCTSTR